MKNFIDKSVVEEKLAELEHELLELERALDIHHSVNKMEYNLMEQTEKVDRQLTKVMTKISPQETSFKNEKYPQKYKFPIAATNL